MSDLPPLLSSLTCASPLPFPLESRRCFALDLSDANPRLRDVDPLDAQAFAAWVERQVRDAGADYAAGGYGENRTLYRMSPVFAQPDGEVRSVHLGVDLWLPAGSSVHAVLDGTVHSTRDNHAFGDYGPTVVLEHQVNGTRFYTLYGHLSQETLAHTQRGARVSAGETIGWLGEARVNGGWGPHLHFQVVADMDGRDGDHPGVCLPRERDEWLARCPNPNLLLRIGELDR
jgi:murein DD-endopeptidase MepM/ murein hydrolase activator NlpD